MTRKLVLRSFVSCSAISLCLLLGLLPILAEPDLLGVSDVETEQDKTVRLRVHVTNDTGEAVGNATVNIYFTSRFLPSLFLRPDYQTTTEPNGVATLDINVKSGDSLRFLIEVSREGLESAKEELIYGTTFPADISKTYKLRKLATGGTQAAAATTTFSITASRPDGTAVPGASIVVYSQMPFRRFSYTGVTNSEGIAQIVTPLNNEFEVVATTGSSRASKRIGSDGAEYRKNVSVTLTLENEVGTQVTVNVIDEKTRLGVVGAEVVLDGNLTLGYTTNSTDQNGNAVLTIPKGGSYSVRVNQSFYEPYAGSQTIIDGEPIKIDVALRPKPKRPTGQSTIGVTVLQGDKFAKIEGGNLPFPGATVRVGNAAESTNRRGYAAISGFFDEYVEVIVEADGYKRQTKTLKLTDQQRYTGGNANVTVLLYPSSLENVIEVRVTGPGRTKGSSVPMSGVTVTAGGESATTRATGRVTLKGDFGDGVEVAVEKTGFLKQAKTVNASGGRATVSFNLSGAPDEDTVTVTVMGRDLIGGSPRPLSDAEVSANGLKGRTDTSGRATITGIFKDVADVVVSAKGYEDQSRQVTIARSTRTGSVELVLEPILALTLLIDVRGSSRLIPGVGNARISVRPLGTPLDTADITAGNTGPDGKATLQINGTQAQLAPHRSGLTLTVSAVEFLPGTSDIPSNILRSDQPIGWTVNLKRDWSSLANYLNEFEARVAQLNDDNRQHAANSRALSKLVDEAKKAARDAAKLFGDVQDFGKTLGGVNGLSTAALECQAAANRIKGFRTEAEAKEQLLRTKLDAGLTLSESCSTETMANGVSQLFRDATSLAREMNELERSAGAELRKFAADQSTESEVAKVAAKVDQLSELVEKANGYAASAATLYPKTVLSNRRPQLLAELQERKRTYRVDEFAGDLTPELTSQLQRLTAALATQPGSQPADIDIKIPYSIRDSAEEVAQYKERAERLLASFRAKPGCTSESMESDIKAIQAINAGNVIELGAAALDKKAEACIQKSKQSAQTSACTSRIDDALFLMENGGPEAAAAKIAEARTLGCDMGKIDEQLDYWKTIRDAVVTINVLESQCRYADAMDFIGRIPASMRAKPLMAEHITRVTQGAAAEAKIVAIESVGFDEYLRTKQFATIAPYIAQADAAAGSIPCLKAMVERFRNKISQNSASGPSESAGNGQNSIDWRPGGSANGTTGGSSDGRKCNAAEAALFARMTGTWRTLMGSKTEIGGSCDNVTGTQHYAAYCENPDATHNTSLPRYKTVFKGYVRGNSLQFKWSNAFDNPARQGSGLCYIGNDGVLRCTSLPCNVSGRK